MPKFRKKPVVIDAIQWTGQNAGDVWEFCPEAEVHRIPEVPPTPAQGRVVIHTLEGSMSAQIGDWIIKGVKGEFYPCKPDIFEATYEAVHPAGEAKA